LGLLTPAALGFAAILPAIVALYFLKLRRRDRVVSSTLLWQPLLADQQANSFWQRLRSSWLLWLQLLLALLLILAATRPFRLIEGRAGGNTVVLLDASAVMQATDLKPNRFEAAKGQIADLINAIGPADQMSLITLTSAPQVLIANSNERDALRRALARAQVTAEEGDVSQGLALAQSLLQGKPDGQIVIFSSGHLRGLEDLEPISFPVRYVAIGGPAPNLAITAFAAREQGGRQVALTQVTNFGPAPVAAALEVWADGRLATVQQGDLAAGATKAFTWPVAPGAKVLEARLPGPDALALDNRAWALVGGAQRLNILLVTPGNQFLQKALSLAPGASIDTVAPDAYKSADGYDLLVFDGFLPNPVPSGRVLVVNPPGGDTVPVGAIAQTGGDPLLQYVDVKDVHVAAGKAATLPPNAHVLWQAPSDKGDLPLIWTEERGAEARVTLNFDLHLTDLVLRPAFPILMGNLVEWLLPPAPTAVQAVRPGEAVAVRPWPGTSRLTVTNPAGVGADLPLGDSVPPFTATDLPGVYRVGQQVGSEERQSLFVVNLFSGLASDLTPAPTLALPAGTPPPVAERRVPREFWTWLAWAFLAGLGLEWWVYHRGY